MEVDQASRASVGGHQGAEESVRAETVVEGEEAAQSDLGQGGTCDGDPLGRAHTIRARALVLATP
jgi:hypothetical protein